MIKDYSQSVKYDPTMPIMPQGNTGNVGYSQNVQPVYNNQPVNYQQTQQTQNVSPYSQSDTYLSSMYSSFDKGVSKYSPFYGKMGNTETNTTNTNTTTETTNTTNTTTNPEQTTTTTVVPKMTFPSGPVAQDIQQKLQEEVQKIQSPQQAVQTIASHAMSARQDRTMANDVAWGARYYAKKALEMSEQLVQNKSSLNPTQIQSQLTQIESLKVKSIGILNDAKKKAINTYNESLKATMLYNHFFTENGQYASVLNESDRKFVVDELNKTWTRWEGGFEKEWQGQMAHADEAPLVIDKASQETAGYLQKIEQTLQGIK